MLKISSRAQEVQASPIRKFLPLMRAAELAGVKVFKINVGDPDLKMPRDFMKTIRKYESKNLPYAPSPGIIEHTKAWQNYYSRFGVELKMENIVPTVGCSEAIMLAMIVVADVGDEVIVFEPLYTNYKVFAEMVGVKLVPVTLPIEHGFALQDLNVLREKITSRTKAVVLINPDNPTGKLWNEYELDGILELAEERNFFVISDETYREIRFDGKDPVCLLNYSNASRVIVVDSVSKRFTIPGARIGAWPAKTN